MGLAGSPATGAGIVVSARKEIHLGEGASLNTLGPGDSLGIALDARQITLKGIGTGIYSRATGGAGGSIELDADEFISITNGAEIAAVATGAGIAANIRIAGRDLLMLDGGISTSSESVADAQGEIDIAIDQVVNLMDGRITSDLVSAAAGGIQIEAPLLIMQGQSALLANEESGSIRVAADLVVRSAESRIVAGDVDLAGIELIHSLQADLNERLEVLPHSFFENTVHLEGHCSVGSGETIGSLIVENRRALPESPEQLRTASYLSAAVASDDLAQTSWEQLLAWFGDLSAPGAEDWLLFAQRGEFIGHLGSARAAAERGIAAGEEPAPQAALYAVLGRVRSRLGEFSAAQADFAAAFSLASQAGSEALLAKIHLDLGVSRAHNRDWAGSLESLRSAERLALAAGDRTSLASIRADLASVLIETERPERARELLKRGGSLSDSSSVEELAAEIHRALALLRLSEERSADAVALRQLAVDRLIEVTALAERLGFERLTSFGWGFLAQVYAEEGRGEEATELTHWAVEAALGVSEAAPLYRWQVQLAGLLHELGELERAVRSYEIAINTRAPLGASVGPELPSRNPFETGKRSLPIALRQVDALLELAANVPPGSERQRLLREARQRIESRRVQELRDYFQDPCITAQTTVSAETVPNTLVVHPVVLEDRLELIVSRGNRVTGYSVPVASELLFETLRTTESQLRDRATNRYLTGASQLYEWLIRPLEHEIAGDAIETLVFVPGPMLRSFPIAALFDRDSKKFLIEKVAIAMTQGLSLTEPRPLDTSDLVVLRVGLTESIMGEPPLRFARRELDNLAALFPGTELVNQDFHRKNMEALLEQKSFDIIHIASHGASRGMPHEEGGLAYVLTSQERLGFEALAEMIRRTRFRDRPTELITLSACETAVGDEGAVLGLAGLSIRAGARSTLATLWRVNDEATAELMQYFYTHLAAGDESRAGALRKAQRAVIADSVLHHPAYWAPFILLGNWL
jgi:CHAT domain-containing protein